jgi:hypothetical protein
MIWTLWLVTFGSVIGQGGAPATVTALATYQSQADCNTAIIQTSNGLVTTYGKTNTPSPGVFFCVSGAPVKR